MIKNQLLFKSQSGINNLILILIIFIGFSQGVISQEKNQSDPVEFAKQFKSVCKVGLKGGDGTLIGKNWILTAGHVAEGMYKRTDGNLLVYFDNGNEYKVKNVFLHPKYVPMGLFDIALLELEKEVKNIIPSKINIDTNEINQTIYLIGHGDKKQTDGTWIRDGKLRGYTNIVDHVNKTHIIFDYDSPENNPTNMEGTSGPGDSGGPAFIKKGNDYYVAGVSSMGEPGINGPTTYGAIEHFVRVSKFQSWILETINNPKPENIFNGKMSITNNQMNNIDLSKTEQSKSTLLIIEALGNYTEEKMINAISQTYDPEILKKRPAKKIISNMPFLIKELQNAKLERIIFESTSKISVKLKKEKNEYILDIFFSKNSQKIEQMAFGKLN